MDLTVPENDRILNTVTPWDILPGEEIDVSDTTPDGFFRDSSGKLHEDRRSKPQDRRLNRKEFSDGDRRNRQRRASDEAFLEREHDRAIKDALEEFAEEHDA